MDPAHSSPDPFSPRRCSARSRLGISLLLTLAALAGCAPRGSTTTSSKTPAPATPSAAAPEGAPQAREAVRVINDFVSMYVLPTGRGTAALIDCGFDPGGAALLAALERRGITPDQVTAIFVTHRHADHVGACHLFPRAKLHAFPDVEGSGPAAVTVTDGQTIDVDGLRVTSYATFGHTPDSGAYLVDGVLYLGDSATATPTGELRASPQIFSGSDRKPDLDGRNAVVLRELHARLVRDEVVVQRLAFGHSDPLDDFSALGRVP
jgi:glyoxylase-like metal-dependent hydrolase (beta-lactamase superfamily II)